MNTYPLARIRKMIDIQGVDFIVTRTGEDRFGEPTDEEVVYTAKGIFHMQNGHLQITLQDKGQLLANKQPRLLLLYTDKLKLKDIITTNNKRYCITGMDNLGEQNICLDLSLEESEAVTYV